MNKIIIFALSIFLLGCSAADQATSVGAVDNSQYQFDGQNTPMASAPEPYPGKTIDMIFPLNDENSRSRTGPNDAENQTVEQSGYTIRTKGMVPSVMERDGKKLMSFEAEHDWEGYWSFLTGEAKLIGPESTQIYIVSTGPGAVCCTNYWIIDIADPNPRLIFRSEEFGSFREPMELFDEDGDGIYELVQFDSCMRYFDGDCGSCSPEPRVYFKYDPVKKQYLPAKGITQDFVKEGLIESERSIAKKYEEFKRTGDPGLKLEIEGSALSHAAQLIHMGEEKNAREFFDKYITDENGETRKEFDQRLSQCKFYQAIRKL